MLIQRETVQSIDVGDRVVLRDVQVGDRTYHLKVTSRRGDVWFEFIDARENPEPSDPSRTPDAEFDISIRNGQIGFGRYHHRPGHDHDDRQSLQKIQKTGELSWETRFPYEGEGRAFFKIPFGPVTY